MFKDKEDMYMFEEDVVEGDYDPMFIDRYLCSEESFQSQLDAIISIAQETKNDYGTLAQNALKTNHVFTTNLVSQAFNEIKTIDKETSEKIEAVYKEQRECIEKNVALIMSDSRKGKITSVAADDLVQIKVEGLYKGNPRTEIEGGCLPFEIKSSEVSEVKCK